MKFMVQFQIRAGSKNKALEVFEQRGPSRDPGVSFRGAWIGRRTEVAFILIECADESTAATAAQAWSSLGDFQITEVIDIDQF